MANHAWMVRAGNDNELIDTVQRESIVAIGWRKVGDLTDIESREAIKERYKSAYPERKIERVRVDAGTLYRFVHEIKKGDRVVTYDKSARIYHIGNVTGSYEFIEGEDISYPHQRKVQWKKTVLRDEFSQSAKNTLGGTLTVFSLENCLPEIERKLTGESEPEPSETEDKPPYIEEVESTAHELISDIITQMDPFDFEELVAAVLRAMGYAAKTTQDGSDHGVDVVAHPDTLGFEEPRVKVQVKRTSSSTGSEDIGRFLGTLDPNEKGLYVSTGGYTRPARREATASSRRITLLDRDEFIELLLEHYNDLEQEYKSQVALKPVYIPTKTASHLSE